MGNPDSFDINGPKPWKEVPLSSFNIIGDRWWGLHQDDQIPNYQVMSPTILQVHNSCTLFY
jgi:hypothetical protein